MVGWMPERWKSMYRSSSTVMMEADGPRRSTWVPVEEISG